MYNIQYKNEMNGKFHSRGVIPEKQDIFDKSCFLSSSMNFL